MITTLAHDGQSSVIYSTILALKTILCCLRFGCFHRCCQGDLPVLPKQNGADKAISRQETNEALIYEVTVHPVKGSPVVKPTGQHARILDIQQRIAHCVPKLLSQWPLKLGTLAAIKSGTQAELDQLVSRNFGSATLQAPPLESHSR